MSGFTVRNLRAALRDEPETIVFDVREPDEYAEAHVAGTVNLPLARLLVRDFPEGTPVRASDEILLFCRSAKRATVAADALKLAGFSRAQVVEGGLLAWIAEGFPIVRRPVPAS